ncbi:tellurite resistance TerB family protein [bacterium SCSIO 12696]|nr:tellurite resistance TerB family protein [bacterium SCSIO 12696]
MNFKGLLDQVMSSGADVAHQAKSHVGQNSSGGGLSDMTKGVIGGAVGGSLLAMLAGNKKARKMGMKVAKIGGAAALGAFAYKVYNDYQANQSSQTRIPAQASTAPAQTEQHSMVVLKAMIAAAKADGHVDDNESARIHDAVQAAGASGEVTAFVQQELDKPLDPSEIARAVSGPEEASEVYLASLLIVDEQNFMEKAYLKELASQLALPPELVSRLEAQVA